MKEFCVTVKSVMNYTVVYWLLLPFQMENTTAIQRQYTGVKSKKIIKNNAVTGGGKDSGIKKNHIKVTQNYRLQP